MKDKKKLSIITIAIFFIVLVIGVSYAYLRSTIMGQKKVLMKIGDLDIILDESGAKDITVTEALPITEEEGIKQEAYQFSIVNRGDEDICYQMYLDDDTEALATCNSENNNTCQILNSNYIRYQLVKQDTEKIALLTDDRQIDDHKIAAGTTQKYELRIWLDLDAKNDAMGKYFFGKIRVEATQCREQSMMKAYEKPEYEDEVWISFPEEDYFEHRTEIHGVIVKNDTMIPPTDDLIAGPWDISLNQDNSVIAYIIEDLHFEGADTLLYIGGEGGVTANPNSPFLATLTQLWYIDIRNLDTSKVTNMDYYFGGCEELNEIKFSNFDTSNVTSMARMFINCKNLPSLDASAFNTSKVTNMESMFSNCSSLNNLDISNFNTSKVTNMESMFSNCSSLNNLDISNFNTSKVPDMSFMFSNCSNLTNLDISNFNTSKATNMRYMFDGCSSLTNLDISNFDTSNVTDMSFMFDGCSSLTNLDISNFDTSNVTDMTFMFYYCKCLQSLNLSNFNTSNVTNMAQMFSRCSNLVSLDISNFNTSKVADMSYMFDDCSNLTNLDISNFDTSRVTNMSYMFSGCSNLTTLNLTSFNISNVTNMESMFSAANKLTLIQVSNNWILDSVNTRNMFYGCGTDHLTVV